MEKGQFSRTQSCATKMLYAVMKEMVKRGGSIPAKETAIGASEVRMPQGQVTDI